MIGVDDDRDDAMTSFTKFSRQTRHFFAGRFASLKRFSGPIDFRFGCVHRNAEPDVGRRVICLEEAAACTACLHW